MRGHLDIRIEQDEVFRLNLLKRAVVAIGESPVAVEPDEANIRIMCPDVVE